MPRRPSPVPQIRQHRTAREKAENKPGRARCKVSGDWVYLGPYGSPEALSAYQSLLANLGTPGARPVNLASLTIGDVVDKHLAAVEAEKAPLELVNQTHAVAPLVRLFGKLPACRFDTDHLEQLQTAMATGSWLTPADKKKRPWCMNRVNRSIGRVRAVFRWAERKKLVPKGTWEHLRTLPPLTLKSKFARVVPDRKPTAYDDLLKVAQYCPDAVACMIEVQWWCGCRSGEIRIMRTCDLDRSGDVWLYRPPTHKTAHLGQSRVIALGPDCRRLLAPWLNLAQPQAYLFKPTGRRARRDHYSRNEYAQAVRRACAKAGVKVIAYGGRHSFKDRVTREMGAEAARAALGHRHVSTQEHYGSLDVGLAKEVARKLA